MFAYHSAFTSLGDGCQLSLQVHLRGTVLRWAAGVHKASSSTLKSILFDSDLSFSYMGVL